MTEDTNPAIPIEVSVDSEIGSLEAVILHQPGIEVESMEPENAEKALYSDILNLSVAQREYNELHSVLSKITRTLEVGKLLAEILEKESTRLEILNNLLADKRSHSLTGKQLWHEDPKKLAKQLIEGIPLKRNTLASFLSKENFALRPLHNFLFVRDTAVVIGQETFISNMASRVRSREAQIMHAIFRHHPFFQNANVTPTTATPQHKDVTIEGGDILVARPDILIVGIGARTTPEGVDFVVDKLKQTTTDTTRHVIVQELPLQPESFIHLDMVFTLLDHHECMVYEPVILRNNRLKPIHIAVEKGEVRFIREEENLLKSLKALGLELDPILCGGTVERTQKREQWHSGANFFAVGPGKVVGYRRNETTIEGLDHAGYSIVDAADVTKGRVNLDDYKKYVVTIRGAELARGGGGCRCLTLPVKRSPLITQ